MGLRRILLLAAACLGLGTTPAIAQDDGTFLERLLQDSLSGSNAVAAIVIASSEEALAIRISPAYFSESSSFRR